MIDRLFVIHVSLHQRISLLNRQLFDKILVCAWQYTERQLNHKYLKEVNKFKWICIGEDIIYSFYIWHLSATI